MNCLPAHKYTPRKVASKDRYTHNYVRRFWKYGLICSAVYSRFLTVPDCRSGLHIVLHSVLRGDGERDGGGVHLFLYDYVMVLW